MFPSSCTDFEAITPYKIALAAIIKNYAEICDGKHDVNTRIYWVEDELASKCKFNRALLSWIHQPDGTLKSILQVLSTTSTTLHFSLCLTLQNLCNSESPQAMDSFFAELSTMISNPPEENLLQRGGILGIFCRWMVLLYDKLEFSQLRPLQDNLIKYCSFVLEKKKTARYRSLSVETSVAEGPEQEKSDSFDEMELESQSELDSKSSDESGLGVELKPSDLKTAKKSEELEMSDVFTSRQAKFFFKQQAMLIDEKESFAMSPVKLQNKIAQILKNNPRLTVAHYLSYLNCRRVREFCGAIDCLLTFYNRLTVSGNSSSDEAGKVCRHASLSLAILHYQFGHRNAAISAAHEAIELSQAASDTQCLLQAISLLHELDPKHLNLTLLEHQVKPAKQLNLSALAVKAIHRDVSKSAWLGKPPCFVFKQLAASEALTRSKAVETLSLASFIHKEALWKMYGKSEMASLFCQLTLSSHMTGCKDNYVYPWQPNSEDVALALCHLVELFHEHGEIPMAQEVLRHLKQRFPREASHSKLWQLTELRIRHKMALRSCKFSEATQVEQDMIALDKQEADFRKSERLYYTGDNLQAHDVLQHLLKNCENSNRSQNSDLNMRNPELMCLIYIYLGRVLFSESSDSSSSLTYLLLALSTATKHYLHKLAVKAKLLITQLQLFSNRLVHAKQSLNSCNHEILTNGSLMEKSRYKLIEAKCKLAEKKSLTSEDLNSLIALIEEAKHGFEILQDLHRQKDATYFLARLYNEKFKLLSGQSHTSNILDECIANRNKYSAEFRQISSLTFSSPCLLFT